MRILLHLKMVKEQILVTINYLIDKNKKPAFAGFFVGIICLLDYLQS